MRVRMGDLRWCDIPGRLQCGVRVRRDYSAKLLALGLVLLNVVVWALALVGGLVLAAALRHAFGPTFDWHGMWQQIRIRLR